MMQMPGHAKGRPKAGLPLSQQLFLLLVVFALGPLFLSNLWGYLRTRSQTVASAHQDVSDVALLEATQAGRWIDQKQRVLPSLVAGNQHLFALSRSLGTCSDPVVCLGVRSALRAHLAAKVDETDSLVELDVLSDQGEVLATSSEQHPEREFLSACLPGAGAGRGAGVLIYPEGGEPFMVTSTSIRDATGAHLGFLCGRFAFEVHGILVMTSDERVTHTTSYLVDSEGRAVCSSLDHNEGVEIGSPLPHAKALYHHEH